MLARLLEYGGAALFKGLAAICGLFLSVVLTRTLGASIAGYFFLFFSIVSVLSVISRLGSDNLILRSIPHELAENRSEEVALYYLYALGSMLVGSVLLAILLFICKGLFIKALSLEGGNEVMVRFVMLGLPAFGTVLVNSFFYLGMGQAKTSIGLPGIILPLLFTSALIAVGVLGKPHVAAWSGSLNDVLWLYVAAAYTVAFFSTLPLLWETSRFRIASLAIRLDIAKVRALLVKSLPFFAVAVLNVLAINIGNLATGMFLDPADVSFLAVCTKIATSIALILTAVNTVVAPRFSRLYSSGDLNGLRATFREARKVTFVIGLIPFALIVLFARPILHIFGPEFVAATTVLVVVSFGQLVNAATGPVTYLLQMAGQERPFMRLVLVVSFVSVAGTIMLTAIFGLMGAAVAVAASAVIMNVSAVIIARRKLDFVRT